MRELSKKPFETAAGGKQANMDARTFDKSKLPSRHVTEGPERAPHRSYYYAMGLSPEQIHQPFVGVATCWNEAAPCNIALMRQAQAVKRGVAAANGTPREFCTITVTDGIAMGHEGMKSSLPSREIIADSVELTIRGHSYDALVGLAGCDKSLPGMMMAMVRLNVPSVFMYGGSIMPGRFRGRDVYERTIDPVAVRRYIGMVFQQPNPFAMSIFNNVAFGLRLNGYKGNLNDKVALTTGATSGIGRAAAVSWPHKAPRWSCTAAKRHAEMRWATRSKCRGLSVICRRRCAR